MSFLGWSARPLQNLRFFFGASGMQYYIDKKNLDPGKSPKATFKNGPGSLLQLCLVVPDKAEVCVAPSRVPGRLRRCAASRVCQAPGRQFKPLRGFRPKGLKDLGFRDRGFEVSLIKGLGLESS